MKYEFALMVGLQNRAKRKYEFAPKWFEKEVKFGSKIVRKGKKCFEK